MNIKNSPNKDIVSISKAAEILKVSIDTLRRWDKSGLIKSFRPDGKTRYFLLKDVEKFNKNNSLKITEAAKNLNISVSTLRRLENKSSVKPLRDSGNKRLYTPSDLEHISNSLKAKKIKADSIPSVFASTKVRESSSVTHPISYVH